MKRRNGLIFLLLLTMVLLFGCQPAVPAGGEPTVPFEASPDAVTLEETVSEEESETEGEPEPFVPPEAYHMAGYEYFCQYPRWPTGCESVSAVVALHYVGSDVTVDGFVREYLPCSSDFQLKNGVLWGPDPEEYFVGSPEDSGSFGAMPPPIQKAMNLALGCEAVRDLSGTGLDELCALVAQDQPVLVWATMNMEETYPGVSWYLPDGTLFYWPRNEHCMLLVGYDEESFTFFDPMKGGEVSFSRELSLQRYQDMGSRALVLDTSLLPQE